MSIFTNLFGSKAQPIEVVQEVRVGTSSQLARNLSRLATLYIAKEQGDTREAIDKEIKARVEACEGLGHAAPTSLEMVVALQKKVK